MRSELQNDYCCVILRSTTSLRRSNATGDYSAVHRSLARIGRPVGNQIEVVLEQAQIKLSSVITDILGKSGRDACRTRS